MPLLLKTEPTLFLANMVCVCVYVCLQMLSIFLDQGRGTKTHMLVQELVDDAIADALNDDSRQQRWSALTAAARQRINEQMADNANKLF